VGKEIIQLSGVLKALMLLPRFIGVHC